MSYRCLGCNRVAEHKITCSTCLTAFCSEMCCRRHFKLTGHGHPKPAALAFGCVSVCASALILSCAGLMWLGVGRKGKPSTQNQHPASAIVPPPPSDSKANARKEPKEKPTSPPPKVNSEETKREQAASNKLTLAKSLLSDPDPVKHERGKAKLREIVRDYAGTKAAGEAERLLRE